MNRLRRLCGCGLVSRAPGTKELAAPGLVRLAGLVAEALSARFVPTSLDASVLVLPRLLTAESIAMKVVAAGLVEGASTKLVADLYVRGKALAARAKACVIEALAIDVAVVAAHV